MCDKIEILVCPLNINLKKKNNFSYIHQYPIYDELI